MKNGDIITQKEYYNYVNTNYYIFDGAKFNSSKFKIVKSYRNTNTNRKVLAK
jgi:hypothetical protein